MRRIFIDMDGVLADFDGSFLSTFGKTCEECESKNEMWRLIHGHDEFFYNLPKMAGVKELLYAVRLAKFEGQIQDWAVLTSAGSSDFMHVAQQKRRWIHGNVGHDIMVITVKDGLDKAAFVQHKGDILIDDWRKNCEAWEANGGVAIKYENAEQAIEDLEAVLKWEKAA